MSIIINDNMEIRAPKPPDGRMVVDNIAQRNAIEVAYRWPGMLVYVKDTGDGTPQWQYLDVTNESQMGSNDNWKPVVSGVEPIDPTDTNAKNIIYGGAEWSGTGLIFTTSEVKYNYFGFINIIGEDQITLDDGDGEDRFDVIAVDVDNNEIIVIKGTPSNNPIFPEIGETQILLQPVLIKAHATTPEIVQSIVYRNNVEWAGGTEGTVSGTVVFNATDSPYVGSTHVRVTDCDRNAVVTFTSNSGNIVFSDYPLLSLRVRIKSSIPSSAVFTIRNKNAGANSGSAINLVNYGLDPTKQNSWQLVTLPTSLFGVGFGNGLSFKMVHGNASLQMSWDLDNIVFSDGEPPAPPSGPDLTGYVKDDGTTPFLVPQTGVSGTEPKHLATLDQIVQETETQIKVSQYVQQVGYVETTGNDVTGEVNNPDKPFLTIKAAVDSLTASICSIHIGEGVYTCPEDVLSNVDMRVKTLIIESDASEINCTDVFVKGQGSSIIDFRFYGGNTDIIAGTVPFWIEDNKIYTCEIYANNVIGGTGAILLIHPGYNRVILNGSAKVTTGNGYVLSIRGAMLGDIYIRGNIIHEATAEITFCVSIREVYGILNLAWGGIMQHLGTGPNAMTVQIGHNNVAARIILRGNIVDERVAGTQIVDLRNSFSHIEYYGNITSMERGIFWIGTNSTIPRTLKLFGDFTSPSYILSITNISTTDITLETRESVFKTRAFRITTGSGAVTNLKIRGKFIGLEDARSFIEVSNTIHDGIKINAESLAIEGFDDQLPLALAPSYSSGSFTMEVTGILRTNSIAPIPGYLNLIKMPEIPKKEIDLTGYIKDDGSIPFTAPQPGVEPVSDADLVTKKYMDDTLNPLCTMGDWEVESAAEANSWQSVAYGDGVWVAISNNGSNQVMRSVDAGVTWSPIAATEANQWFSVAYGNGVWVAVSNDGTNRVMRSTDTGVTWTPIAAASADQWQSVAYGDGVWIAVEYSLTNRIMRSTDAGLTWSSITVAEANPWSSVAYGDGVWVAVANGGTNRVMRSTDAGATWNPVAAVTGDWLSVAYGDGVWIAVAWRNTNRIMRSTDAGVTWSPVAAAEANGWSSVAYGDGVWIAVAWSGTNRVMRSVDAGVTWTSIAVTEASSWSSVAYGGDVWVAVANGGTNRVMRSVMSCPPNFVKDDGSIPFKSPQPGVSAVNSNDLTTLAQVESLIANSLLSMIWMGTSKDFDSVTNSGFQYSFGAGEATTSTFGLPIPYAAQVTNLYIRADSQPSLEANLELWINGVPSDAKIALGTTEIAANVDVTSSNIMLQPGDFLNIKTLSGEGGRNSVVTIVLRNIPA